MTDDIDRVVRARVVAGGLPLTPGRNPWRCRAVSGLALVIGFGGGEVSLSGSIYPTEWGGQIPILDWDVANATESGGVITALPDASPSGNDAVITASYEPVYSPGGSSFSGAPTADFTASGLRLTTPAVTLGSGGAFTVYMVGVCGGIGSNEYTLSAESDAVALYSAVSGDGFHHAWFDSSFAEVVSNDSPSTPFVVCLTSSGETSPAAADAVHAMYVSSTTVEGTLTGKPRTEDGKAWMLGNYYGAVLSGYQSNGSVARFMIFDTEHDSTTRNAILSALGSLYSVTIT